MNIFTSGYELTTGLTNILTFIVSVFCYFKIKTKYWTQFYLFMCIDSFLGIIVHIFKMSIIINNILWIILSVLFVITINMFLKIFLNLKTKYITIASVIVSLILLTELILKMDYLLTFLYYTVIIKINILYY